MRFHIKGSIFPDGLTAFIDRGRLGPLDMGMAGVCIVLRVFVLDVCLLKYLVGLFDWR